jgi:hypothetical protein
LARREYFSFVGPVAHLSHRRKTYESERFYLGSRCFRRINPIYLMLQMKGIGMPSPFHFAKTQTGIDITLIARWTIFNPMWWIAFNVLIAACSLLFMKAPPIDASIR